MQKYTLLLISLFLSSSFEVLAQNWVIGGNSLSANGSVGTKSNYSFLFKTYNKERGRITNSGLWGIGTGTTITPNAKLHINSLSTEDPLRIQVNGNTKMFLHRSGGLTIGSTAIPPSNGLFVAGNVVVGTTSSTNKFVATDNTTQNPTALIQNLYGSNSYNDALLIQAGNNNGTGSTYYIAFKRPDNNIIGSITQSGPTTVSYNTTSDKRLKINIHETKFGLKDVNKIQVKDYNFLGTKSEQTGFLAQELYEVFPEAVSVGGEDPQERPWMIDYGKITPLLVKAVQELSKENQELKEKADKVDALEARLQKLETLLIKNSNISSVDKSGAYLEQCSPNPFNQITTFNYNIPPGANAQIVIYESATGKLVRTIQAPSVGKVQMNGSDLPAGNYIYALVVNGKQADAKQMIIFK